MLNRESEWLSTDEIAKHFGVSTSTVIRWEKHKNLPFIKTGRIKRYNLRECNRWFNNFVGSGRNE